MPAVRRSLILLAATTVAAAGATAPASAAATKRCPSASVHIFRGDTLTAKNASCHEARRVMRTVAKTFDNRALGYRITTKEFGPVGPSGERSMRYTAKKGSKVVRWVARP